MLLKFPSGFGCFWNPTVSAGLPPPFSLRLARETPETPIHWEHQVSLCFLVLLPRHEILSANCEVINKRLLECREDKGSHGSSTTFLWELIPPITSLQGRRSLWMSHPLRTNGVVQGVGHKAPAYQWLRKLISIKSSVAILISKVGCGVLKEVEKSVLTLCTTSCLSSH